MIKEYIKYFAIGFLISCHQIDNNQEYKTSEACCTTNSDMELKFFQGCRIPNFRGCKKGEIYWMRGHVSCSEVDEYNCKDGRCCHYWNVK